MAKNLNIRIDIINQLIDACITKQFEYYLPSQTNLAAIYNVSRTTIKHAINYLVEKGVVKIEDGLVIIVRTPTDIDKQSYIQVNNSNGNNFLQLESYLQSAVQKKQIKPSDIFTELQLAKAAKVDVQTVRAYLTQFSRFHLVTQLGHGQWKLLEFTQHYADKLFELREMLECHALKCFIELPKDDIRWVDMKFLYEEHKELSKDIVTRYTDFALLDHRFHSLLLSAANNPFINDFIDLISLIFHFHYQWDNRNLQTRNILAVSEHLAILMSILSKDYESAKNELKRHLQTAKKTLIAGISIS
ncbi:MAG: GntR family transcriptional regulator [[Actinobacillus] rossii]|uniref:GntR family transcriptional regulator n=1 Tax=[Actinobacillus] rossii TaxID=123820 RepID=A0A380TMF9_9PAST|nr:GntR family transcriptional regulator [[Actinobacillus] rossii]MDY4506418.1 GntR family transcriptional regulator [[Actinobacillus] rossii]SUT88103.1 GntR family transcriptional regulator [[Actinobacillus] rossii]